MSIVTATEKKCGKCRQVKPASEFYKNKSAPGGLATQCKACQNVWIENNKDAIRERTKEGRKSRTRRYYHSHKENFTKYRRTQKYGISTEDYSAMLKKQGGVCAICGGNNKGKKLCIDHDHQTGRVRALLCNHCNWALGQVNDDIGILEKAIEYLKRFL